MVVRLQSAGSLRGHTVDLASPSPPAAEPERPRILKPPDEVPPPPTEKAKLLPARETPKTNPPLPAVSDPTSKGKAPASGKSAPGSASAPSSSTTGTAGTTPGTGSGTGVGGLTFDQPGFNYPYYYERVKVAIETNWFKPAATIPTSPVVHFTIQKDGKLYLQETETPFSLAEISDE